MNGVPSTTGRQRADSWQTVVAQHQRAHPGRATWQLLNTFGSYIALWCLMYLALKVSGWIAIPLAILAGGMLIRVFIILHDCGHGSFFAARWANSLVGSVAGLLAFTPFQHWRWQHAVHHATSGDLDRRGVGDIWTMTVQEYVEASRWKRLAYRLARNPVILFGLAPLFMILVKHRIPSSKARARERRAVWCSNGMLLALAAGMCAVFGVMPYVLLQSIVLAVAGGAGVWLFYVQHQFDSTYWERADRWDFSTAALRGSSFYELPRVLQWFSGNIGFHHVHHLSPRIPNYNLERCHRSDRIFDTVQPVTMRSSLRSLQLHLWDEGERRLISFRRLRELLTAPVCNAATVLDAQSGHGRDNSANHGGTAADKARRHRTSIAAKARTNGRAQLMRRDTNDRMKADSRESLILFLVGASFVIVMPYAMLGSRGTAPSSATAVLSTVLVPCPP